jgi:type II secretory pathway pseudopilin PulG
MTRARRRRRGASLLEVLVGLAMLAIAGASMLALLAQTIDAVRRQQRHDAEIRAASERLDAVAVWTRAQLEARVGTTPLGPWTLRVAIVTGGLYHVALADPTTEATLLETSLYRPDSVR